MNKVQYIEGTGGERLAVLPEKDFNVLAQAAEDLADIASYDTAKQTLDTGTSEMIPAEYANRLINGENPIRVWREYRGLSAKALAETSGISGAYLSEIETGKKEGRVSTLKSIAVALGVDLDDLV